ncbi:YCF48-related protein [Zavarzinia compransoris]|uniref:WD40/YVTN/BNR-like repeat-containing protein n=1 Tax=Zavarzinia marina TaxID=2911065 RepID=UPI001F400C86|nr:YCF48-related protein [Zavarzinia marina]MCF4167001.1 YCF48-related protein [Zavarzinia marina]
MSGGYRLNHSSCAGHATPSRRAFCAVAAAGAGLMLAGVPSAARATALREFPDDLFGVAAFDDRNLVAVGYHGAVKISADGGETWRRSDFDVPELLRRVVAMDGGAAFTVGHQGGVFGSTDHGASWQELHREPGLYLRALAFADAATGWVVGHEGTILRTTDGGRRWQRQALADYTGRDLPRLSGVAVLDARRAITVGEFGVVARTLDGGATWNVASYREFPTLTDIAMRGDRGLAVGLNGTLLTVTIAADGGIGLAPVATGMEKHLLAVSIGPDGRALVAGQGVILDGTAEHLSPAAVGAGFDADHSWIGGVLARGDGTAFGVGQYGTILRAAAHQGAFGPVGRKPAATPATQQEIDQ